jgi:hypothetical protein
MKSSRDVFAAADPTWITNILFASNAESGEMLGTAEFDIVAGAEAVMDAELVG